MNIQELGGGSCGCYFLHTLSTSHRDRGKLPHPPEPSLEKGLAMPMGLRHWASCYGCVCANDTNFPQDFMYSHTVMNL